MARKTYEITSIFPGLIPKIILPDEKCILDINTNTIMGIGLTEEWLRNMPFHVHAFYKNNICDKEDPKYFLWNLYSFFVKNFKFVIEFEYLNRKSSNQLLVGLVRPSVYVDNEFIVGLDWKSNKWSAIQQMMIHFLHEEIGRTNWYGRYGHMNKKLLEENNAIVTEDILT